MVNSQDGWISVLELVVTVFGFEVTVTVGTSVTVSGSVIVGVIGVIILRAIVTVPIVNMV